MSEAIQALYDSATGSWEGIDWTEVTHGTGSRSGTLVEQAEWIASRLKRGLEVDYGIDLSGRTESVLLEAAETTASEGAAKILRAAAKRVAEVEASAAAAEAFASRAMQHATSGRWESAAYEAESAAREESKYGDNPTWGRFARAVRAKADEVQS